MNMRIGGRVALVLATVLLASSVPFVSGASAQVKSDSVPDHVANQALVGAKPGGKSEARRAIENNGGSVIEYNSDGNFFIVRTPSDAPDWVAKMQNNRSLRYAELDYILRAETHLDAATPNDPKWSDLYGIQKIGSEMAWDATTGSSSVVVGVIDTGVDYKHEDLSANMWRHATTGQYGRDCRNDDNDPFDDNGHGTHVAGTIGGAGNNGKGVVGVNWTVNIMALKFLSGSGSGSTSDAVECLYWARDNGADLTSNSWGGGGYSQTLYDAINASRAADMLFMAAAGNDGDNTDEQYPHYPSSYDLDNIVSVAATDKDDALASWSNYGALSVDVAAPGVGILSTIPGNKYDSYSGTSMATPHVAGAAALLLAAHPSLDYAGILDRIYGSADAVAGLSGKVATGGRLNVAQAIESDTVAPGDMTVAVTGNASSATLSWTAPAEDGTVGVAASSYGLSYKPMSSSNWARVPTGRPKSPGQAEEVTIGGLLPATSYDFRLLAKDNVGNLSSPATVAIETGAGSVVFSDDMDGAQKSWQKDSPWAETTEAPHSPTESWSDSPGGPHGNGVNASLYSPSIDLSTAVEPKLTVWQRYSLERNYDYGYVYCNKDGGSWNHLATYNGAKDYHAVELDLAPCAGSSNVLLRFRMSTDRSVTFDGWFIDNVVVRGTATDSEPPAAPTGLAVSDPSTGGKLDLDWADNSEGDLAGYSVYRTTDPATSSSWTNVAMVTASVYSDTGLNNGTTYYYRVTAVDTSGNESAPSNEASGMPTDTTAPAAPQSLTASAGDTQVALDWADNTESDLAGYHVYRTIDPPTSSDRTWTKLTGSLVSGSAYTDTGLTNDTTYYYFVTAVDTTGNESGASNEASATPAAAPASSSLHVHDLDGTGVGEPRGYWHAKVSVFVHDDNGNPVSDATVSYDWDIASSEPSCVTDATGWCTVRSDSVHKGGTKSITLTVTGISHATLAYSGANHDAEGDSNGTSITVNKPN